jgi:membrane-associated protease RseP (regulator of RpoE activity)
MLIRILLICLIAGSSFLGVFGQTGNATNPNTGEKTASVNAVQKRRDVPFPGGVDLQFLIKELAKDLGLNVLFDPESRLDNRKVMIELRNVTTAAALDSVLLQEGLYFEETGPKTILVANRFRGMSVPSIGVGWQPISGQLAEYFGVSHGILINNIRENSPASKSGLKAGDVIVGLDGTPVGGTLGLMRAIDDKSGSEVTLTIVRDHESRTISVAPQKGVQAVL